MKEKVVIIGIGIIFNRYWKLLKEKFEVIALADNGKKGQVIEGYSCIGVTEIISYEFDKLIICSTKYESVFREQLISIGIPEIKICSFESVKKYLYYDKDIHKYKSDKNNYIEACGEKKVNKFLYDEKNEYPVLSDYRDSAGSIDDHYFFMDIMMAKEVIRKRPKKHFDIGSRIDGFISHLLANDIDITVIDIRALAQVAPGCGVRALNFIQSDATNLENIPDDSVESLSALHSIEHFGLGRYGDTIDPEAYIKAIRSMIRVLKPDGGCLYFAVPVGKEEKLCFNAHRIFSPTTILDLFKDLELEKMYLLHNMKFYEYSSDELMEGQYLDVIGEYDCGLFILKKNVKG